jgi:formylglycine-generating enzyme required for sulfatase activity
MMGSKLSPDEFAQKYGGKAIRYRDEHRQHNVKINKPFFLQTSEVTQGQWKTVIGTNPSYFKKCGDNCPVESISWEDANKFIKKLNEIEGDEAYRLPTEAEWEYACRAGTTTEFSFGDDADKLDEYAWYYDNSKAKTHPGGQKNPNPWGLYDMHGNVWEWEENWHDNYKDAPDDGRAWIEHPRSANRVFRGGDWDSDAGRCRAANRSSRRGRGDRRLVGFRLARSVALNP